MSAYYNENDPRAAATIREAIRRNLIAPGDVDERSIEDVRPDDLRGYIQCHFFAGFGIWAYALDLAGWPRDRPVWTGSCPCQPFSQAGKGAGFDDQRHLWPAWYHLIRERRPAEIFGEQVASKSADPWVDLVQADMEAMGHAFGCVPFPAAGIGSPNIRDRNYWLAYADHARSQGWRESERERPIECTAGARGVVGGMGDAHRAGSQSRIAATASGHRHSAIADGDVLRMADTTSLGRRKECQDDGRIVVRDRPQGFAAGLEHGGGNLRPGPVNGFWRDADWLGCRDGKWRPVEPGTFPLAHGAAARVGRLRGYGNAINAQAAAEFVRAYLETQAVAVAEAA